MLTLQELRKLDTAKLEKELKNAKIRMNAAKFSLRTNQDKKSHVVYAEKTYIAQIETVKSELANQPKA